MGSPNTGPLRWDDPNDTRLGPRAYRSLADFRDTLMGPTPAGPNRFGRGAFYDQTPAGPGSYPELRDIVPAAPTVDPTSLAGLAAAQPRPAGPGSMPELRDLEDIGALGRSGFQARPAAPPPDSLAALAYKGEPEWGGVRGSDGSSTFTLGQMAQDMEARDLINARNDQRMSEIGKAQQRRGDPQDAQLRGRARTLQYESMMPAGEAPIMRFGEGDGLSLKDFAQRFAPQRPTIGQEDARQKFLLSNPKVAGEVQEQQANQRSMAGYERLRAMLTQGGATEQEMTESLNLYARDAARENAVRTGTYGPWAALLKGDPLTGGM